MKETKRRRRASSRRFAGQLIGLARRRLDDLVRQKVDPEDVVQSAFKSFFRRQGAEPFELHSWDSLWSLLTLITLRKCGYRLRQFRTDAHDVRRERSADVSADEGRGWQAVAREPTPEQAALLAETVEQLFRGLSGVNDHQVIELSLQGYRPPEISTSVGCSERLGLPHPGAQ